MARFMTGMLLALGLLGLTSCGDGTSESFTLYLTLEPPYTQTTPDGLCHGAGDFDYIGASTEATMESTDGNRTLTQELAAPQLLGDGACQFVVTIDTNREDGPYLLSIGDAMPVAGPDFDPEPVDTSQTRSLTVSSSPTGLLLIGGTDEPDPRVR